MSDSSNSNAPLTLASLRRRGKPSRSALLQPDLFSTFEEAESESLPQASVQVQVPAYSPIFKKPELPAARPKYPPLPSAITPARTSNLAVEAEPSPEPTASVAFPNVPPQTWTVSSLVRHVRGQVERGYGQVTVEGEISNWRPAGSGHCYFTIKDAGAQLSAVLFRRQASLLRFRPADGDAVRLHGQLSVYESRGQMQLIVEWVQQVGLGALLAAVQQLKERLRREGLFDRKRPLPAFPRCIGIVTSLQGAALRDIVKVCKRRHAAVRLLIYPAAVQGPNCPAEIAAGVRWFSAHPEFAEVVLVARGGGSWEDLHGFDDEGVARAIAACALPVITGIGHAPDSTIADAAADLCAPTPSAAAELLTAAQHRVEERLQRLHARLLRAGSFELLRAGQRLSRLGAAAVLLRVEDSLNRRSQRIDELQFRTETALRSRLRRAESRLAATVARLGRQNPLQRLREDHRRLESLQARLDRATALRLTTIARRTETAANRLVALSPLRVLERGYALVYGPDGHLLRAASTASPGERIRVRLAAGELRALVTSPADEAFSQPESPSRV